MARDRRVGESGQWPYSYAVDLPPLLGIVWIDSGASKVIRSTGRSVMWFRANHPGAGRLARLLST